MSEEIYDAIEYMNGKGYFTTVEDNNVVFFLQGYDLKNPFVSDSYKDGHNYETRIVELSGKVKEFIDKQVKANE